MLKKSANNTNVKSFIDVQCINHFKYKVCQSGPAPLHFYLFAAYNI